ncbi:MAG TPA: hypothetical protein VFR01_07100 [Geobacterales bacterium]|nr:hypothetical protein [Geobacterales bacterium]
MVVGYNHNIRYKGEVFHIQTEDTGLNAPNPTIITLLYQGGTIVASKKTTYDDIIKIDNLDKVVEELMKEQHKQMLLRLKAGEFDQRAFGGAKPAAPNAPAAPQKSPPSPPPQATSPIRNLDEIIIDYLASEE